VANAAKRVMPAVLEKLMRHSAVETTLRHYAAIDADDWAEGLWRDYGSSEHACPSQKPVRVILPALTLVGKYLAFTSAPRSLRLKKPKVVRVVRWIPDAGCEFPDADQKQNDRPFGRRTTSR
jgi:hypothetical protein